jgi:hypothetical protein
MTLTTGQMEARQTVHDGIVTPRQALKRWAEDHELGQVHDSMQNETWVQKIWSLRDFCRGALGRIGG